MNEEMTIDYAGTLDEGADNDAPAAEIVSSPDRRAVGRCSPAEALMWTIGRVGSDVLCEIADGRMSRRHASITGGLSGPLSVVDMSSKNGTFVNGVRVMRAELEVGDVVRLGDTVMVVKQGSGLPEQPSILTGRSEAMVKLRERIRQVAPTTLSVLVTGETGTGKDLVAQQLHDWSARRGRYVAIDCGAMTETLAASALFGHVRGAFTGAEKETSGAFRDADGGTLFLDEIGNLPLRVQQMLLRALQTRTVSRVGTTRATPVDVRVVAATNADLLADSETGTFRADLLARLNEWPIPTTPLRDRRLDIVELLSGFTPRPAQLTGDAAEALLLWRWPFNVRELKTVARRLEVVHLDWTESVRTRELPDEVQQAFREARSKEDESVPEAPEAERDRIIAALVRTKGNVALAVQYVPWSRKTLYRRMKELEINPDNYR